MSDAAAPPMTAESAPATSADSASPTTLALVHPMSTAITHAHPRKRNAKPKPKPTHGRRQGLRNAGPSVPRASTPRPKLEPQPSKKDTFVSLLQTLGGAAATSMVGAVAVRWGLHPELVSTGLGAAGAYLAWQSPKQLTRQLGAGAASAAGSQLLLLKFNPTPAPARPVVVAAVPPHSPPPQLPGRKNADLGSLPPGMLDAAFERARAELAVAGDGYPTGYEHDHHQIHHGPVRP